MKKYIFIGGHLTPAIAVMDELLQREPDAKISFFGRLHTREGDRSLSAEYEIITRRKIPFYSI